MSIAERLMNMSEDEQERLAEAIVYSLEGGKTAKTEEVLSETEDDDEEINASATELERLLIKWLEQSAEDKKADFTAEAEKNSASDESGEDYGEDFLSLKLASDEKNGEAKNEDKGLYGRNAARPAFRSQMEQISNFFMRDSRRYDAGFERF